MNDIIAYHDRSAANHQKQFDDLRPKGYRMISLSVYNYWPTPKLSAQYAAVWVKRPGPSWAAIHNVGALKYQLFFDKWAEEGYHPVLLSISGTGNALKFAGTMEKRPGPIPLTRFGLRSGSHEDEHTFQFWDKEARDKGWILTHAAVYGFGDGRRYAGIWSANTTGVAWGAGGMHDTTEEFQDRYNAQISGWGRPAFVALSEDYRYLSVFRDDRIGQFKTRHGLTTGEYQQEYEKQAKEDFYPISVQGGGIGAQRHFAVVFARKEFVMQGKVTARQWSASGGPVVPAIDQAVQKVMQDSNCRGAALALVKGTRLILARGYTLAEPGYPIVQPTTVFRLASVSKVLTGIAVYKLIEEGKLTLDTRLLDVLPLKTPGGGPPVDARFNDVTIRHLLEYTAGLTSNSMWLFKEIQKAFNDVLPGNPVKLPITPHMAQSFIAAQMMKWAPGAPGQREYSNACYWLAGRVVAKLRGTTTFADAIKSTMLAPLGITRIRRSFDLIGVQPADEARYHSPNMSVEENSISPGGNLVPAQYGGNNLALTDASGGMSAAAVDLARIMAALNAPQGTGMLSKNSVNQMLGNAAANTAAMLWPAGHGFDRVDTLDAAKQLYRAEKGGEIHATQSGFWLNQGGIGLVIVWNTNEMKGNWFPDFPEVINAANAHTWPAKDLFPDYGMPSLVQLGQVGGGLKPG
jgi:CubicO group peptidase (beta-lactamase class C family)